MLTLKLAFVKLSRDRLVPEKPRYFQLGVRGRYSPLRI